MDHFPEINIDGPVINAKDHIAKGTKFTMTVAVILGIVVFVIGTAATAGIMLIFLLIAPIAQILIRKKAMALIHGSGVHISDQQFPEIHECVETFKKRLSIKEEIEVYLVEDNISNAFVVQHGKKNVILLTDDLIHGCLASNNPKALAFVIGHELGHIALNHMGTFRSYLTQYLKGLRRLDEYSADAVALALVEDKKIAFRGLLMLTVGHAMMRYVNLERLVQQTQEVANNKHSRKAERQLTHPLLLNRLNKVVHA
jgi:Zn-dependent protease with chaperone function